VRVRKTSVRLRKTSVRVQYIYYQNIHTLQHTHTHTHTLQNNIKPPQYKLKQTIHRTTQITTNVEECGPCPVFASFYPGICLTTEEKSRKNLSEGKKNLSQSTVYMLPKHPHITKHTHTHTHTHTLQNNIKPPQYKLKQTQCKIYSNEIVTIYKQMPAV